MMDCWFDAAEKNIDFHECGVQRINKFVDLLRACKPIQSGRDFIIFKRPLVERRRLIGIRIEFPLVVLGFSWSRTIDWHINDIYGRG